LRETFHENDGTFDMLGGTIDMGDPLFNSGKIIGQGVLITGGLTNEAGGSVTFTGGVSQLEGTLTNQNTSRVLVTGGAEVTFRNDVTNTIAAVFTVDTSSIATFFGTVTGLSNISGFGTKIFQGPASGGSIDALGKTIVQTTGNLSVGHIRDGSLEVYGVASIVPNGINAGTSRVNSLLIASPGRFDLTDNDLIVDYTGSTPIGTIQSYIQQGFAAGAWTGNGLTSSAAASAAAHPTGLGYAEASTLGLSTFDGQSIDNTTLVIRYTYRGDANLDGLVNALDFNALASNFGSASGRVWTQGDFNYDSITNTLDFNSLAANFNQPAFASQSLGALIPEPSLLVFAVLPLLARRRRGYGDWPFS
jgi:hypothetical protein